MRVRGRVLGAGAGAGALARLACLYISIQIAASDEYGVPIEIKLWDTGRTPLAHMVDVTNGFGLKVLAEHNFLNDNNIAFSPYGLQGILVALYEGIDGESSYQVQRAMLLPWNRNVMRIGFRDIHRTLKTYFVPEEGFLAGLALNNENVTFNDGYKKVLRFYGFDLDNNEQLPTLPPTNGTNDTTSTVLPATSPAPDGSTTPDMAPTQPREDPTTNPNAETLSDVDIRGPTPTPTTASPSSAPNSETTTAVIPSSTATNEEPTSVVMSPTTEMIQTTTPTATTTSASTTTTVLPTAEETTTTSTIAAQTATEPIPTQMSSTVTLVNEPTANNEVDGTTSDMPSTETTPAETTTVTLTTVGETTQTTETSSTMINTNAQTETTTPTMAEAQTEISTSAMPEVAETTIVNESTLETLQRRKKSIVDFIFTNPPYVDDYLFQRSFDIPIAPDQPIPDYDRNTMFLANGLRNVQVTYMQYDTILEHAYLPHLEASALRLPLDSDRYYLLVVLPDRGGAPELGRLLARMARESDLSDICSTMRPRRVRAIVPSFTVKGHVTLTTDLQKLGIRDVFEPRQRDFTPMTHQGGVYVRSIEQAVSVAIRKYRAYDTNSGKYVANRHPVSFSATYPFLYFVMDSTIHVALMAGKMVDPLNSRIL